MILLFITEDIPWHIYIVLKIVFIIYSDLIIFVVSIFQFI